MQLFNLSGAFFLSLSFFFFFWPAFLQKNTWLSKFSLLLKRITKSFSSFFFGREEQRLLCASIPKFLSILNLHKKVLAKTWLKRTEKIIFKTNILVPTLTFQW